MSNRHTDALHYALLPDVPGMLGSTLKQVAWELCWHATDAGKCWASNQTVAEGTGLDRGTVRKAIKWLWAITLIKEIEERWTDEGDRTSNMITLRQVVDIPEGAADHKSGVKAFQGWEERVIRTDSMRFGHSAWARWTPRVGAPDTEGWVYYAPTVGALRTDGGCVQHPRWVYHAGTVGAHGTDGGCVAHPKPSYESLRLILSESTQVKPQQQQLPGAAAEAAAASSTSTTKPQAGERRCSAAYKEEEITSGAIESPASGESASTDSGSALVKELLSGNSAQEVVSEPKANVEDSVSSTPPEAACPPGSAAPPKPAIPVQIQKFRTCFFRMIKKEPEGSEEQFNLLVDTIYDYKTFGALLLWTANRPAVLNKLAKAKSPLGYFMSAIDRYKGGWLVNEFIEWADGEGKEAYPGLIEESRFLWDPDYKPGEQSSEGTASDTNASV